MHSMDFPLRKPGRRQASRRGGFTAGLKRIFFYRQEMRVSIFAKRRFPMHAKNVNPVSHTVPALLA